jgi:hypothetical protein
MRVRPWFSIFALVLSLVAAIVSLLDGDTVELAFFVLVSLAAGTQAWLVREPGVGWMPRAAQGIAIAWVLAAIGIGVLLQMYQSTTRPPAVAEATYFGLTATVFHLMAVYGGAVAALVAAFGPRRWLDG